MTQHHDLAHEFPEMKDTIHTLKTSDRHFQNLLEQYEGVSKELHRAADGAAGISDEHAEDLKKQRLELKDKLYAMLVKTCSSSAKTGTCGSKGSCG